MPINDDKMLRALLDAEEIAGITLDTNIFDEKNLQLNSFPLRALSNLKNKPIQFILSSTVTREVAAHLENNAEESLREAKRAIGQALFSFETKNPTRDEILETISGGRTPKTAAESRLEEFLERTGCTVLNDASLVGVGTLFDDYFLKRAPFGTSKKKSEFPDALALNALAAYATSLGKHIIVVSKDGDWKSFCKDCEHLHLVSELEKALDFMTIAPMGLRDAIKAWLGSRGIGRHKLVPKIADLIEKITFYADGHPVHGELEAYAWAGKLVDVDWPEKEYVDVIDVERNSEEGVFSAIVSLPLNLVVEVPVELNFSIWDGIDREAVGISGREIEVKEDLEVRATLNLKVLDVGAPIYFVECENVEIDISDHHIDLGEVPLFEDEDREYEDEE